MEKEVRFIFNLCFHITKGKDTADTPSSELFQAVGGGGVMS